LKSEEPIQTFKKLQHEVQTRSQPEIFLGARVNYGGATLFFYSDENKKIKCLYRTILVYL